MIDPNVDVHIELAKIQKEIEEHLGLEKDTLVFDYSQLDGNARLNLITINPRHHQSFLFHSVTAYDKLEALNKMLNYVKNVKDKENHYTVQWMTRNDSELHTSYFRASNIYDALDKLYFGRDMNTITVFSVVLNPIT